jgi:hypothetical protein
MTQRDAARTYTLEKQHLEGPPTLHRIVIRLDGSIVAQYHEPGMTTEWSAEYPLSRDDAADGLRIWRRFTHCTPRSDRQVKSWRLVWRPLLKQRRHSPRHTVARAVTPAGSQ